ncbi:MAG TPA: hypothetical protein VF403_05845 [Kofleriaceae bacterium]
MRLTFVSLILASALTGCIASGGADVTYGGGVAVSTPDLVEVSPGVQVVADYDDSVFYSDGFYWRNDGGNWYRSTYYSGGWGYYASPPQAIITINEPYRYRNYRPSGYQPRHQPYRQQEPIRDHRSPQPNYRQPEVRDHRSPEPVRNEPEVRDHRSPEPVRNEPVRNEPVVRDHRAPEPVRSEPVRSEPVVRDHRSEPARPVEKKKPAERDHR